MEKEEASMRVRVSQDLHNQFITTCKVNDQTASQVIRSFMREYVGKYTSTSSPDKRELINEQN